VQVTSQKKEETTRANDLESELVSTKMKWANLDMENDELAMKLSQKNELIKKYST